MESKSVSYFVSAFMKPGHDHYVYSHPIEGGITAINFNVGRSDRSGLKVTGKCKQNAQQLDSYSALCKVCTKDATYMVRCCVKGSILEVHDRFIKQPELLSTAGRGGITAIDINVGKSVCSGIKVTGKRKKADRHRYIAIIMPKPAAWLKVKDTLLGLEEYKKLRVL